ncbi:MAG TPA: tetratricopeptide repeat protein [Candidatus Obscuribacterales bacterium]
MPQKLQPVIVNYARLQQLEALEPESYLALAYVALELDQPAQALSLLARILRLDPGHAEARALYLHLHAGRPLT